MVTDTRPTAPLWQPPDVEWLRPYRDGLSERELRLPRCSECAQWCWYPLTDRSPCHHATYLWEHVGATATLFSFTRVQRSLIPGHTEPYVVGLVLPEYAPRCRVAAVIADGVHLRCDAALELRFTRSDETSDTGPAPYPYYRLRGAR
ncbi:hypothetical protein V1Y59_14410 [Gordonia sp. PKS22-38]|uniref:DUF35 domain-containing protein n=1 Tax=Gordonia prachuapensis TaxID=3115651 RepID=A0ABU7MVC8_9ACTN|nr:hypothetical protein [Gordonia sp. PKS22-38]